MGFSSFNQERKLGTMDDDNDYDEEEGLDSFSSNFSDDNSSVVSSESDSNEDQEVTSSSQNLESGALSDMSSILKQLPVNFASRRISTVLKRSCRRGLSKHFQGKSQSFTSLSNVLCVEDLAKPENPYNKKLKSCKSYGGLLLLTENTKSKNKMASKGSCSSLMSAGRNNNMSFLGNNRPPIHHPAPDPHRSTSTNCFSNQTPLFA